ncbi:hypothetical protein YC2023_108180 [Brassica napus]
MVNQIKISSDGNEVNVTEKASSVQSAILYDCDAEALSNSIRPSQSYSPTIKWRCCPRLFQFHGFRSVEVLLDAPPESPKNCRGAKEGSVQSSPSRPVSVFMIKPRVCPSRGQFSPVQSRHPFGFGQVLSDQPVASRLEHCELACVFPRDCVLSVVPIAGAKPAHARHVWGGLVFPRPRIQRGDRILPIERRNTKSPGPRFPLLEARSWQEAKSNLVTVAGRGLQLTE